MHYIMAPVVIALHPDFHFALDHHNQSLSCLSSNMADYVRRLVSGNKARFKDGQLNLELGPTQPEAYRNLNS
jgi:hypothetical protein